MPRLEIKVQVGDHWWMFEKNVRGVEDAEFALSQGFADLRRTIDLKDLEIRNR